MKLGDKIRITFHGEEENQPPAKADVIALLPDNVVKARVTAPGHLFHGAELYVAASNYEAV